MKVEDRGSALAVASQAWNFSSSSKDCWSSVSIDLVLERGDTSSNAVRTLPLSRDSSNARFHRHSSGLSAGNVGSGSRNSVLSVKKLERI